MNIIVEDDSFKRAKELVYSCGGELLSPIYVEKIATRAVKEGLVADEAWMLEMTRRYRVRELRARLKRHFEASLLSHDLNQMALEIETRGRDEDLRFKGFDPAWSHFLFREEFQALKDVFGEDVFEFLTPLVKPSSTHPYWASQFMETVRVIGRDIVSDQTQPATFVAESVFFDECLHARKEFRHRVADLCGVKIVTKEERPRPVELPKKKKPEKTKPEKALVPPHLVDRVLRLEEKRLGGGVLPREMIEGIVRHSLKQNKHSDREWLYKQIDNNKRLFEHAEKVRRGDVATPVQGTAVRPMKRVQAARMEIVLKFDKVPIFKAQPLRKGKLVFHIEAEDYVWDVVVNRKAVNKSMKTFESGVAFVGVVKGQLGEETSRGFEIINASLQVFERAPKQSGGQLGP